MMEMFIFQTVEGEHHEKAVDLLKQAQGTLHLQLTTKYLWTCFYCYAIQIYSATENENPKAFGDDYVALNGSRLIWLW